MKIKYSVLFTLELRKKDGIVISDNVPIRMRVTYKGNRIEFSTGYRIDSTKWDKQAQRVKPNCTNYLKQSSVVINTELSRYEAYIEDVFKEYEVQNSVPTSAEVKKAFNTKVKPESNIETRISFYRVYDEFLKVSSREKSWVSKTYQKQTSAKNNILAFNPNVTFEYWDERGLYSYIDFLIKEEGMRNVSVKKQLSILKGFLNWATQKGYNKNLAFKTFKPILKTISKKVVFLTDEEIASIEECKIPRSKNYLERVRDVLLFQCYTGLRHSDVYKLKRTDIKSDCIEITTTKTSDNLVIELNNHSRSILDKYSNYQFEGDRALPVISNQKMNDYLKELGMLAEINEAVKETYYKGTERIESVSQKYELLGTHTGRRTFICKALALNIPIHVVMKWTGHSDYKTMKPYIDIADNLKANEMKKFN